MSAIATPLSKEGTLSQSFWSSFIAAGDRRSGRMDSACPSLMYAGPRLVTISRICRARLTSFACRLSVSRSQATPERKPDAMPPSCRMRVTMDTGRLPQYRDLRAGS